MNLSYSDFCRRRPTLIRSVPPVVIDIGGSLSHGEIVASELGILSVITTGDGRRRLPIGDRVTVDCGAGSVRLQSGDMAVEVIAFR
ncbi:PEP-utilizing enzyme [Mycobacterium sp.]|uniref:PEP-utilizing enzyme n=1 Tax=Mycobacterium sp. TaxID=1785 RepID=UPI003BB1811D